MYRAIIVSVAIYLIIAAYLQIPELMQYDSKRILQLTLFVFVGTALFSSIVRGYIKTSNYTENCKLYLSKHVITIISILFVAGLISVILASNLKFALLEFSFFFLIFSLIVAIIPLHLKSHYFLGKTIFATALFFSALYLIIFFGNYISSFFDPMIITWPEKYDFVITINDVDLVGKENLYFDHKRFFNHTQTWSIPILIGLLTYFQKRKNNRQLSILLMVLISLWWMLIFAAGGRGSILGILCALFFIFLLFKKDATHLLKNGLITISLGSIFYFIFFKLFVPESFETPLFRSTASGRYNMWDRALELWMQNPLFGVGPMHYAKMIEGPYFGAPHNLYLQILSEWGIIAFFAFVILLIILIKSVYKNYHKMKRNESNKIVYLAFTWSILAAFTHAFFSGIMNTPMSQIWLVLVLAWLLGFNRYADINNSSFMKYNYVKGIYILLLCIVVWLSYDDIFKLIENYKVYMAQYPESQYFPRFWVQGLFE